MIETITLKSNEFSATLLASNQDAKPYASVKLTKDISLVHAKQTWYRTYFTDFIANFGALALTVMKSVKFVLSY